MSFAGFKMDDAAFDDLFLSVDGPAGQLIAELSEKGANIARAVVHVRPGTPKSTVWSPRSTARPIGFTKAGIRAHGPVRSPRGHLYGGVNAPADPTIFLEKPAEQMDRAYPFLTTALDSLEL